MLHILKEKTEHTLIIHCSIKSEVYWLVLV